MSSRSSQLELDESDLWGDDDAQVQSAAPSDAEGQDDIPDGHMATPAGVVEASSDESNSGVDSDSASGIVAHRELAQAPDSKQSSSGALPGAAAAAAALAARHPGMAGSDSNASLTRAIPGGGGRRRTLSGLAPPHTRAEAAMAEAAAKLGSSVPIAIPMAQREEDPPPDPDSPLVHGSMRAATFVPPHLLHQQSGGFHAASNSVHGTSPAASLKRERLVNRNAILRSTGFLEEAGGAAFLETMDPIRESALEVAPHSGSPGGAAGSPGPGSLTQPSGLSWALKPPGGVSRLA